MAKNLLYDAGFWASSSHWLNFFNSCDTITPYEYNESLELINSGVSSVDISGYAISDCAGNKIYFPSGIMLPAGEQYWTKIASEITTNEYIDSGNDTLYFYIPVVVSSDGFVEKEGKSGHYDTYFDRNNGNVLITM